jgi:uncharacterized membrane protein
MKRKQFLQSLRTMTRALHEGVRARLVQQWFAIVETLRGDVVVHPVGKKRVTALTVTRDLNEAVHRILIVGLAASALLMVIGVAIELAQRQTLPTTVLPPALAIRQAFHLDASGFLSLGVLMLILTPLLRVVGSLIVFVWERDGRYAAITGLVLIVMLISLWVGQA